MVLSRKTAVLSTSVVVLIVAAGFIRARVTLKGSLVCNGACVPDPKPEDHFLVLFAIDGTAEIRSDVDRIASDCFPEKGLDAEAAQKLLDQFDTRLKYYIAPDSQALKHEKSQGRNHYCSAARSVAVTGAPVAKYGKKWISADKIEPAALE
jgi:hypothetical protein